MDHTWFGVNDHTMVELPLEVMQFGDALSRILWLLQHANPDEGLVYMAKFNISDGFYCLFLEPNDAPKLVVLMPKYEGELQLVAMPLSLTMGWVSSLPTFCTASRLLQTLQMHPFFAALCRRTVSSTLPLLMTVGDCPKISMPGHSPTVH